MKPTLRVAVASLLGLAPILGAAPATSAAAPPAVARPNILWITAEDISPSLGCYGDPDAVTPNLDAFANEGLLFRNCLSIHPC